MAQTPFIGVHSAVNADEAAVAASLRETVHTTAIMFRHILAFQQVARRTVVSTTRRQMENKVPEKQKLFQEDNGMPVHLKGGASDALLYRTTMALTVLGVGYVLYELVTAAFPQKK